MKSSDKVGLSEEASFPQAAGFRAVVFPPRVHLAKMKAMRNLKNTLEGWLDQHSEPVPVKEQRFVVKPTQNVLSANKKHSHFLFVLLTNAQISSMSEFCLFLHASD